MGCATQNQNLCRFSRFGKYGDIFEQWLPIRPHASSNGKQKRCLNRGDLTGIYWRRLLFLLPANRLESPCEWPSHHAGKAGLRLTQMHS